MVNNGLFRNLERLILASGSPRRQSYLQELGINFDVFLADNEETPERNESPLLYVARMSKEKCGTAMESNRGDWVLAADTIVFLDDLILGKPKNRLEALDVLMVLSGRTHEVATSYMLGNFAKGLKHQETVVTRVTFTTFTKNLALQYIETGEPMDKAGAYGIQGRGAVLVKEIEGSYSNVVGLPLAEVVSALNKYRIAETK